MEIRELIEVAPALQRFTISNKISQSVISITLKEGGSPIVLFVDKLGKHDIENMSFCNVENNLYD